MKNYLKLLYFVVALVMLNSVLAASNEFISTNKNTINFISEDSVQVSNIFNESLFVGNRTVFSGNNASSVIHPAPCFVPTLERGYSQYQVDLEFG